MISQTYLGQTTTREPSDDLARPVEPSKIERSYRGSGKADTPVDDTENVAKQNDENQKHDNVNSEQTTTPESDDSSEVNDRPPAVSAVDAAIIQLFSVEENETPNMHSVWEPLNSIPESVEGSHGQPAVGPEVWNGRPLNELPKASVPTVSPNQDSEIDSVIETSDLDGPSIDWESIAAHTTAGLLVLQSMKDPTDTAESRNSNSIEQRKRKRNSSVKPNS